MGKKTKFEVKRDNIVVNIYRTQQAKGGKTYVNHVVVDKSNGKRRLRYAANLDKAKAIAKEIAEATVRGKSDTLNWEDGLRAEIRKAIEAVGSTGITILPAAQLFAQAVKILTGRSDELLAACQYWMSHRPDAPLETQLVKDAVCAYLQRRTNISARRRRNLTAQLGWFKRKFGDVSLHEVKPQAVRALMDERGWSAKTSNDFLSSVSLLYKEAQFSGWVPKGCNATEGIVREKVKSGRIGIFEPAEVRHLFERLVVSAPELVAFMAIWCFSGIRKEEISRLSWPQVNRGLLTGFIEIDAVDSKTNNTRNVPVLDNLRAWLTTYRREQGKILPAIWLEATKSAPDRLSELVRYICRKTGIAWKANAPRHSYGTYHFKICKDPGMVVAAMGNSLHKFEKFYWSKSKVVTDEAAAEYFGIKPEPVRLVVLEKVV